MGNRVLDIDSEIVTSFMWLEESLHKYDREA